MRTSIKTEYQLFDIPKLPNKAIKYVKDSAKSYVRIEADDEELVFTLEQFNEFVTAINTVSMYIDKDIETK